MVYILPNNWFPQRTCNALGRQRLHLMHGRFRQHLKWKHGLSTNFERHCTGVPNTTSNKRDSWLHICSGRELAACQGEIHRASLYSRSLLRSNNVTLQMGVTLKQRGCDKKAICITCDLLFRGNSLPN